jgi:hypothetical protein
MHCQKGRMRMCERVTKSTGESTRSMEERGVRMTADWNTCGSASGLEVCAFWPNASQQDWELWTSCFQMEWLPCCICR